MAIELSRVAHYSGEGLDHPIEVWHGKLDNTSEVYFTQPYDRSRKVGAFALTTTKLDEMTTGFTLHPSHAAVPAKECAMLFNAAAYPADVEGRFHPRSDASEIEEKTRSGALMQQYNFYRSIGLPLPFEERR